MRPGSDGHTVLRFSGAAQQMTGMVQVRALPPAADGRLAAVADLSTVYADSAAAVQRSLRLKHDGTALIDDRWTARDQALSLALPWLTDATVRPVRGGFELRHVARGRCHPHPLRACGPQGLGQPPPGAAIGPAG